MTPWSAFYPFITHLVKGCPAPLIDASLRDAASELCDESLVWQETDTLSVTAGTAEYDVPLIGMSEVVTVVKAATPNRRLYPTRQENLDQVLGWESTTADEPSHFYLINPELLGLYPTPRTSFTLTVRVAYRPGETASGVPDAVYLQWRDAIVWGALARIKGVPEETFTDLLGAEKYARKYEAGKADARGRQQRGHHYGSLSVAPKPFC